ncbi:MAG: OB-fold nucleic acid binding domain-containing protein [Candidatus Altiarchaeota archaeon]
MGELVLEKDVESLILRVVTESGKSRKEVKKALADRKEKTHGLLSDYGAIYAVAKECGIDLNSEGQDFVMLGEVKPTKSLNVIGRVREIYPSKEFNRKDGSVGKLASLILYDKSGVIRLVLWDKNASFIEKIKRGDLVMASNAYAKKGMHGVEAHAGNLSNLLVNPTHIDVEIPVIAQQEYSIKNLAADMSDVTLHCRVNRFFPAQEFSRKDGSIGKRASALVQDETGSIRIVLWDLAAEKKIKEGDIIKIENGYVRQGLNQELELQVSSKGRILPSKKQLKLPEIESTPTKDVKISEIKPGDTSLNLNARILTLYPSRPYSGGTMASLIIGDETGTIRAVLWNETSPIAAELNKGDIVEIKNTYSKANLSNEAEIHLGRYSGIKKNNEFKLPSLELLSKSLVREKDVASLENNDRDVRITGEIVDFDEERSPLYMTCPNCKKKVQSNGPEAICEICGDIDPTPNLILSMVFEDSTGNIRVVAFRENAEKVIGMDAEEAFNLIAETQDEQAPVRESAERLMGQKVSFVGHVRYNDFSDQLEFLVDDVAGG